MRVAAYLVAVLCVLGLAAPSAAQQAPLVQAAATPPQRAVAVVVAPPGALCPELVINFPRVGGSQGDLRDRCTEIVVASNQPSLTGDVQFGLQQMAPYQVTGQGTGVVETSGGRVTGIAARLGTLRRLGAQAAVEDADPPPGELRLASLAPLLAAPATAADATGRLGIFVNGTFSTGDVDPTARESGFDFDTGGGTLGVDYRILPSLVLGVAFVVTSTRADFTGDGGKLESDDFGGSIYGAFYPTDRLYVDAIVSAGITDYSLDRNIGYALPSLAGGVTTVNQTARADTDGTWYTIAAATGYDIPAGALTVTPLARVHYTRAEIDGYRERISGTAPGFGLALDVESQTVESLTTALGAQASYAVSTPVGVVVPQVRGEWMHEFLDDPRTIRARFVDDPSPGPSTTIAWDTDSPDRDYFSVGAGVSATFPRGVSIFVYYETVLSLQAVTEHRMTGGVRVTF